MDQKINILPFWIKAIAVYCTLHNMKAITVAVVSDWYTYCITHNTVVEGFYHIMKICTWVHMGIGAIQTAIDS